MNKYTGILKWSFIFFLWLVAYTAFAKMGIHENVNYKNFPKRLKDHIAQQTHWKEGFLDVTKAPYNAKGNGSSDDTEAIQKAINDAFASNLIVYFPSGTYLISNQLRCIQPQGKSLPVNPTKLMSQRKFGHLLMGSNKSWPTIKLKDNSKVNENILIIFAYINDNGVNESSRHYLASIRNFNIDMGNNPNTSALSNSGAQYSVIQNISICGNFDTGIYRIPGSGGYSANITITGGKVGIRQDEFRPCPTVIGLKLIGQSHYGIELLNTRGALTLAGFKIVGPNTMNTNYSAIYLKNTNTSQEQGAVADLILVDGTIETQNKNVAINNYNQNVVIKNVWCKADNIISSGIGTSNHLLTGDKNSWKYIDEYVFAAAIDKGTVCIDGDFKKHLGKDILIIPNLVYSLPSTDLIEKHLWGQMPSWEDEHVNIVSDFGVTPDDNSDDDTLKIQQAIDAVCTPGTPHYNKTLFIPRGHYHLKSTLILKDGLKMIGAGKNISVLSVADDWLPKHPTSVITTASGNGDIILSDLALSMWSGSTSTGTQNRKNFTLLDMNAGNITIRDVQTDIDNPDWKYNSFTQPFIRFSDAAGGKVYGLCVDLGTKGAVEDTYSLLSIENTYKPLVFYQTSIEDVSEPTTPEEEEENLIQLKVTNCSDISIYGFKYEGRTQHTLVKDTEWFRVYGGAGNYWMADKHKDAIFEFKNTNHIYIANMSHDPKTKLPEKAFIKDNKLLISHDSPTILFKK